jgi:hypothetical protein
VIVATPTRNPITLSGLTVTPSRPPGVGQIDVHATARATTAANRSSSETGG